MADVVYQSQLNDKQVLDALNRIDKSVQKVATDGAKQFEQIGQSANLSGAQIGAMSGIVSSLTTQFIQMGQQAIGALVDIGKQSVQTAIEIDTLKARLGGIFDGNKEAADQAFTFIQQKSKELGIDLGELAGAFIPKTESLAQFERVAKLATALARSDPEQGAMGARIALIEALSGTFTSLQRRFEIPKGDIDRLKEAFDTQGMEGFLTEFEKVLDESGKGFEDLADTAQASFDRLAIAGEQLGGRLGTPILEALQVAADKLAEFVSLNEDDLIVFADTIGRTIADVINFISSVDLSGFDTQSLIDFASYLQNIVVSVQLMAAQFSGASGSIGNLTTAITGGVDVFGYLVTVLSNIDDAFVTLSQGIVLAKASYAGLTASLDPLIEAFKQLTIAAAQSASFDYAGAVDSLNAAAGAITNNTESQAAFNASIMESQASFDNYKKSIDDNANSQKNLREELEKQKTAGTGAADAIQAKGAADRQAADDADKLAEAQTKVNEETAKAQKDFQRKLEDIDIATERKRLDIAIEFAQKREDAAKDNLEKIADIREKYGQSVNDAATDLSRKEEDIARKFGEKRIDQEKENRQKRVDIETDYRRTLQDIQAQFLSDADEAEQKRDAVAFLRAMKERDKKVSEAQVSRQQEITDAKTTEEQKRAELAVQRQREIEEAQIDNERKLEDLKTNLDRQIEAQNTAYARQLDDIATSEQRKNDELKRSRERDIEDAKLAYNRKLEDLQTSLAAELAAIEEFAAKKAAAIAEADAIKSSGGGDFSIYGQQIANKGGQAGNFSIYGQQVKAKQRTKSIYGFASGGYFSGTALVGENGPELITGSGHVTPNATVRGMGYYGQMGGNSFDNSRSFNMGLLDPGSIDTILASKLEQVLARRLMEIA